MEHIHPKQALEILSANPDTLFIDCRTEAEFYYVGHPSDAVNLEWNTEPDFKINPHFCESALAIAGRKERPIILICRSGNRSVDAGLALEKYGFTNISNILEGFEGPLDSEHHRGTKGGWRFHGLSWRQL